MSFESWALRHRHVHIALSYRPIDTSLAVWPAFERLKAEFGRERLYFDGLGRDGDDESVLYAGSAPCVLLFIGTAWQGPGLIDPADTHRREIEAALANPRTLLLPVLVGGAELPATSDLPRTLRPIVERPALRLATGPHYDKQMDRLVGRIRARFATMH